MGGGSGIFFGPGAAWSPMKPQVLCEPSQNGFSFDAPQRHSANGFFGTMLFRTGSSRPLHFLALDQQRPSVEP